MVRKSSNYNSTIASHLPTKITERDHTSSVRNESQRICLRSDVAEGNLVEVSPPSYPGGYPPGHWVTPGPTPSIDELCHKFSGRPTELRLPSRSAIPSLQSMPMTGVMMGGGQSVVVSGSQGGGMTLGGNSQGVVVGAGAGAGAGAGQGVVVAGECLDGEAIKRRLMANRLPESCV